MTRTITQIAANQHGACALAEDGTVWSMGPRDELHGWSQWEPLLGLPPVDAPTGSAVLDDTSAADSNDRPPGIPGGALAYGYLGLLVLNCAVVWHLGIVEYLLSAGGAGIVFFMLAGLLLLVCTLYMTFWSSDAMVWLAKRMRLAWPDGTRRASTRKLRRNA